MDSLSRAHVLVYTTGDHPCLELIHFCAQASPLDCPSRDSVPHQAPSSTTAGCQSYPRLTERAGEPTAPEAQHTASAVPRCIPALFPATLERKGTPPTTRIPLQSWSQKELTSSPAASRRGSRSWSERAPAVSSHTYTLANFFFLLQHKSQTYQHRLCTTLIAHGSTAHDPGREGSHSPRILGKLLNLNTGYMHTGEGEKGGGGVDPRHSRQPTIPPPKKIKK